LLAEFLLVFSTDIASQLLVCFHQTCLCNLRSTRRCLQLCRPFGLIMGASVLNGVSEARRLSNSQMHLCCRTLAGFLSRCGKQQSTWRSAEPAESTMGCSQLADVPSLQSDNERNSSVLRSGSSFLCLLHGMLGLQPLATVVYSLCLQTPACV
jgi:hypothetical protein